MTPNSFAFVALWLWPLVALFLYSTRPVARATIWTILGAYLIASGRGHHKGRGDPTLENGERLTMLNAGQVSELNL